MKFRLVLCILVAVSAISNLVQAQTQDKILQTSIPSLIFKKGEVTTYRRATGARPQLECVTDCGAAAQIVSVMCENKGFDGRTINWRCESETMPGGYTFGSSMKVVCEGYDSPTDPYVLAGSCALKYSLVYTTPPPPAPQPRSAPDFHPSTGDTNFGFWFLILVIAAVGMGLACVCLFCGREEHEYTKIPDGDNTTDKVNITVDTTTPRPPPTAPSVPTAPVPPIAPKPRPRPATVLSPVPEPYQPQVTYARPYLSPDVIVIDNHRHTHYKHSGYHGHHDSLRWSTQHTPTSSFGWPSAKSTKPTAKATGYATTENI